MENTLQRVLAKKIADKLVVLLQQIFARRQVVSVSRFDEIRIGFTPKTEDFASDEFAVIYGLRNDKTLHINYLYRELPSNISDGMKRVIDKFCETTGFKKHMSYKIIFSEDYILTDVSKLISHYKDDPDVLVGVF